MSVLTIALLAALAGAVATGGTILGIQAKARSNATEQAAAQVEIVKSITEGMEGAISSAVGPELNRTNALLEVAKMPAANLAIEAMVNDPDASAELKAAVGVYLGCVAGAQPQAQGAAAFNCEELAEVLVKVIDHQLDRETLDARISDLGLKVSEYCSTLEPLEQAGCVAGFVVE